MTANPTLDRLRRANPVTAGAEPDDALFAQLVARPGDPRLGGLRGPRRRRILVAALVAAAILVPTGFGVQRWLFGSVPPRVTKQEYRAAQGQLTLPPGITWPQLHVPEDTVTSAGAGGGHAVVVAETAWECYWVGAIRRRDSGAEAKAQAALTDLLDHHVVVAPKDASENWTPPNPPAGPYAVFADDGGMEYLRANYAKAAAGDPSGIAQSCKANS
jgi:hypothetical protein